MYNAILVDDEPRTVEALEKNVDWRRCGVRRTFRASGMQEAIRVITQERIDILICDIEMPGGSGLRLLEWLRGQNLKLSCVFVTCHPEFAYMRKAIQLNCYDYILKPIDYEEFERVLTELVAKMEAVDAGERGSLGEAWTVLTDEAIERQVRREKDRDVEQAVKKYVREHMVDNIAVTDIAEELHFNPQYLMRTFKARTGMSIMEYIIQARITTAKRILRETELPVKTVADMTGYADYAYFTRVFKKNTGQSPTDYRNAQREKTD